MRLLAGLRHWPARRWWVAAIAAIGVGAAVAIPTALFDNPLYTG